MSNKTNAHSRRNFLKGFAYTSALSLGGLSCLAFASNGTTDKYNSGICGISVSQQQVLDKESVTLINQSNESITLDALEPVRLERINGSLVVKVNQVKPNTLSGIEITPSQRITFDIQEEPKPMGSHLQLISEHTAFNIIVPVQAV